MCTARLARLSYHSIKNAFQHAWGIFHRSGWFTLIIDPRWVDQCTQFQFESRTQHELKDVLLCRRRSFLNTSVKKEAVAGQLGIHDYDEIVMLFGASKKLRAIVDPHALDIDSGDQQTTSTIVFFKTVYKAAQNWVIRRTDPIRPLSYIERTLARNVEVSFFVRLQLGFEDTNDDWEVHIWHNCQSDRQWTPLALENIDDPPTPLLLSRGSRSSLIHNAPVWYFTGEVPIIDTASKPASFTIRYRASNGGWRWVKDDFLSADGEICCRGTAEIWQRLDDYFQNLSREIDVELLPQDPQRADRTAETYLWSLRCCINAAEAQSSYLTLRVGLPCSFTRWFSLVRVSRAWLCPRQGRTPLALNEDAIVLSFLRNDGLHLVLLALSLGDVVTIFRSTEDGYVSLNARNDALHQETVRIFACVATSFEAAIGALMKQARKIVWQSSEFATSKPILNIQKPVPWYDGFAYCTWNGLGRELSEQKLMSALDTLETSGISVSTMIIDDNWQSLDGHGNSAFGHRWKRFEANEQGFPNGLRHAIEAIREAHPSIKDVAVWHGIFGYWNAISLDGEIAVQYGTRVVKKQETGFFDEQNLIVVDADHVRRMYDDFYRFLSAAGISAVKTDVQSLLDSLSTAEDRRTIVRNYQQAWSSAVLRHLNGKAISSMSQIPQNLFLTQLLPDFPQYIVRNSDDFFPNEPSAHTWHIFCNAHNSMLTQHLNVIPDWDMFQTNHAYSSFHAAARCLSGGPIYITDEPGAHDLDLIGQMTAKTPDRTVILRPGVGRSMGVYMAHHEPALCKVGTVVAVEGYQISILGVFNVSNGPLSELAGLESFPDLDQNEQYIVRLHLTDAISGPLSSQVTLPIAFIDLPFWGWEVLSAYPLRNFSLSSPEGVCTTDVAVLGLLHKITGAAAIKRVAIEKSQNSKRLRIQVALKALGTLGVYISDLPKRRLGVSVTVSGKSLSSTSLGFVRKAKVLEIDLERAWVLEHTAEDWNGEVVFEFEVF